MPENLTPWTDPELEARVVALVLGEASDFERDQLRELIAGNAELAAFQKRMDAIHGLLLESCGRNTETTTESASPWQLPHPQRQPLLDVLSTASAPKPSPAPNRRVRLFVRPAFWWSAAACFVVLAAAAVFLPLNVGPSGRSLCDVTFVGKTEVENGRRDWGMAVPQSAAVAPSTPSAPPPPPAEPAAAAAPAKPSGSAGTELTLNGAVRSTGTIGALSGNVSMVGGNEVIVRLEPEPKPATSPAPAAATPQAQRFGRTVNRSSGDATLDLSGANTYSGGTTVNAGTAIGSGGIVKSGAGTLTMNGGAFTASGVVSGQPASSAVQLQIDSNAKTKDKVARSNELAIVPRSGAGIYSYSSATSPIAGKSETTALPQLTGKDLTGYISKREIRDDKKPAPSVPEAAKKAVARRQEMVSKADEAALRGQRKLADRDYEGAVDELKKSVDLVPDAPVVESRKKEYSEQLAKAKVALAKQRAEQGRYGEASSLSASVAQEMPSSEAGQKAKQLLKDINDPDIYSPAVTPEHMEKVKQIQFAQKTAEGHARIGDYDGAEKKYEEVLDKDPYNSAARKGLEEVERQRKQYYAAADDHTRSKFLGAVAKQWETEVPKFELGDKNDAPEGVVRMSGLDSISEKLKRVVIPKIEFKDTPVDVALEQLRQKARESDDLEADPAKRGVNIVVRNPSANLAPDAAKSGEKKPTVTLNLSNVPLEEALRYTTEQANLKYKADPNALVVVPAGEAGGELYAQVVRVPPSFLSSSSSSELSVGDPFSDLGDKEKKPAIQPRKTAREILESVGVTFPAGSNVIYNPNTSQLIVRNTQANLELVQAFANTLSSDGKAPPVVEVRPLDPPNAVQEKLYRILIPDLEFVDTPLSTALDFLRQKSRDFDQDPDPNHRGVGIVWQKEKPGSGPAGDSGQEPRITLKLSNIPLRDALRYTTELAELDFTYDKEKVLVGRSSDLEKSKLLQGYAYKVSPELLRRAREKMATESSSEFSPAPSPEPKRDPRTITPKELFEEVGVCFPNGSRVEYDAEREELVVYNTQANQDLIQACVESWMAEAPTAEDSKKDPEPEPSTEIATSTEPFSTFSLHVSDVSFKLAKASLAEGKWPDPSRIRIEEFVNAFDYGDPSPSGSEPVACALEQSIHPFQQARNLLRISLRTASAGRGSSTPLRLTLLLDSSGSMERADRRETLQAAITQLTGQLNADDRVTLVTFARQPRLQADQLPGDQAKTLPQIIANTPSEGGTNLETALKLAVEKAREHFQANAQNRIVLLTDGAANLGDANPERLTQAVEAMRRQGIAFDTAGIGADGLNDTVLEALSRKGDGRYYLLDSPDDAGANFAAQLAGAFRPAAKNVKVQVWFNPDRVRRYRLLGFEEHRLDKEDFRNDSVDAAELAAAEAGVAMYQFEPLPEGIGDIGYVSVRFQEAASGQMIERRWPISYEANPQPFEKASAGIRLAASAAFLAAKLGDDPLASRIDLSVLDRAAANEDLRTLIHQTRNLSTTR